MIESAKTLTTPDQATPAGDATMPFRGTRGYVEAEAAWFYGRDHEAGLLADLVQARRQVVLLGPPGRGKTSLVRAGVLPRLEKRGCRVLPVARVSGPLPYHDHVLGPGRGSCVFAYHAAVCWSRRGTDPRTLLEMKLDTFLKPHRWDRRGRPTPLVAVFDQFEDFFILHPKRDSHRQRFFEQLRCALAADPLLRVLFVLRDQFLPHLLKYAVLLTERDKPVITCADPGGLLEQVENSRPALPVEPDPPALAPAQFRLERLSALAVCKVLSGAFEHAGWKVASEVTTRLSVFLAGNPDVDVATEDTGPQPAVTAPRVEPLLLQLACRKLCTQFAQSGQLPLDAMDRFARERKNWTMEAYLEELYDEQLQQFAAGDKASNTDVREQLALALATKPVDFGYPWREGLATIADLRQSTEAETTARILHDLSTMHPPLLVREHALGADDSAGTGAPAPEPIIYWYEFRHETLGPAVLSANAKWKEAEAGEKKGRREPAQRLLEKLQLPQRAAGFSTGNRSALLNEQDLAIAENWREYFEARESGLLTPAIDQLIDRSKSRIIQLNRQARRRNFLLGILLVLLTVAVVLLVIWKSALNTEHQARREEQKQFAKLASISGVQLQILESSDVPGSSVWFSRALQAETQNQLPDQLDRVRLSAALGQLSRPAQIFLHEKLSYAEASRDGRHVLTVGDGGARVWVTQTGQEWMRARDQEDNPINSAIFGPDGRHIVILRGKPMGATGSAEVWDVETKQLVRTLSHNGAVNCAAFSKDGTRLVTGSEAANGEKGEARVWDAVTFEGLQRLPHDGGGVACVAFSHDGKHLVTGTREAKGAFGAAWVWPVAVKRPGRPISHLSAIGFATFPLSPIVVAAALSTERPERPIMKASHKAGVSYAAFCPPDGRLMVSVSGDVSSDTGEAKVWDVATGQLAMTPEHKSGAIHADFSPEGSFLVTTSHDGTAKVWEVIDGSKIAPSSLLVLEHGSSVFHASFTPGGRFLITSSRDQAARVWELATGKLLVPPLCHNGTVSSARFSSDARQVLTTGPDTAHIWEVATSNPILPVVRTSDTVNYAALSKDGHLLVVATGGRENGAGEAQVSEVRTGKSLMRASYEGAVTYAAFNTEGSQLVTASKRGKGSNSDVQIVAVATGKKLRHAPLDWPVKGSVTCAAFSHDGARIALANELDDPMGKKGEVWIWDTASGGFKAMAPEHDKPAHNEPVTSVAFNHDGSRLVTTSTDDTARIWDVQSGELRATLKHTADVSYAAFSADSRFVITVGTDRTAKIWSAETDTAREATQPVAALSHGSYLNHGAFSPDGKRVVTAGQDGQVRVWDVDSKELITIFRHRGNVQYVSFNPAGDQVLALSYGVPSQVRARNLPVRNDVARNQIHTRLWGLATFEQSAAGDLELYSEVLSARRYDPEIGNLVPLEAGNVDRRWAELRKDPREFPFGKPMSDPADPHERAWHQRRADEAELAQEWFAEAWHVSQLIAVQADKAPLFARRARAYAKLPSWRSAAIDDYTRALKINPRDWQLWSGRAELFYNMREWEKAVADYSKALELDPANAYVLESRSWAYSELHQWEKTIRDASKAIELEPEQWGPWRIRAWAKAELKDAEGAREDYEKAIDLEPNRAQIWYELALIHLAKDDRTGYRKICERMIELFALKSDPSTINSVAWTCVLDPEAVKDWTPLRRSVEQAVTGASQAETRYLYLNTLGAILYRAGDAAEAVKRLNEAMKTYTIQEGQPELVGTSPSRQMRALVEEGTAWDWVFLAMAHHRLGNAAQARKWLDKATNPTHEDSNGPWTLRLELKILRNEAKAFLNVQ